jgi:MFS family permease
VAGLTVCCIFAAAAFAQLAATRAKPERAVALGCGVLIAGSAILAAVLHFSSLTGLIAAAVVCGIGQGISFGPGLAAVAEKSPPERRAEVSSTYYVVAYVALSVPIVGMGLAAQDLGLRTAGVGFAIAVGVLAAVCLVAILIQERRAVPA